LKSLTAIILGFLLSATFDVRGETALDPELSAIESAKEKIVVVTGSFIRAPLAKAMARAHKRGVKLEVCFERYAISDNPCANFLAFLGAEVLVNSSKCTNSFVLIDNRVVFLHGMGTPTTGSPSLLRPVTDSDRIAQYMGQWEARRKLAQIYAWNRTSELSGMSRADIPAYFRFGTTTEWGVKPRLVIGRK
jgi:hypothetical protein